MLGMQELYHTEFIFPFHCVMLESRIRSQKLKVASQNPTPKSNIQFPTSNFYDKRR